MKWVGLLCGLRNFLPRDSLITIYKSFVRPYFDYSDVVYHSPTSNASLKKLESAQYQVALAITGAWKGSSAAKLYEDLGWETLAARRCCRRLLLFWKINKMFVPAYLSSLVPQRISGYQLRSRFTFNNFACRTSKFKVIFSLGNFRLDKLRQ